MGKFLLNQSDPSNYLIQIIDKDDDTSDFEQMSLTFNIPGFNFDTALISNKIIEYETYTNASHIAYDPLNVSFILDEDFFIWEYYHRFKERLLKNPETFVVIKCYITSNKKNWKRVFTFHGCHFENLSTTEMRSTNNDRQYIVLTATYKYESYHYEVLTVNP